MRPDICEASGNVNMLLLELCDQANARNDCLRNTRTQHLAFARSPDQWHDLRVCCAIREQSEGAALACEFRIEHPHLQDSALHVQEQLTIINGRHDHRRHARWTGPKESPYRGRRRATVSVRPLSGCGICSLRTQRLHCRHIQQCIKIKATR